MRLAKKPILVAFYFFGINLGLFAQTNSSGRWVGTWSTSEVGRPQTPPPPTPVLLPAGPNQCPPAVPPASTFMHFNNQTLRQVVHTSIGGSNLRIVLSNAYGTAPLTIGGAHIALREKDSSIRPESGHMLSFSGRSAITIPANAVVYSDPVNMTVPAMADLAVDLYLPGNTDMPAPLTVHDAAFQTNYVSSSGNHVGKEKLPILSTAENWFILHRVEVQAPASVMGLVTFGDSITDGRRSTLDANNRWPDHLARRLLAQTPPVQIGVMNAGIAGNRVLSESTYAFGINALARFEHNALAQSGVTHIIVMEGINDIGNARTNPGPSAEDVIAGYKQMITQAHNHGLKIYGATLTPFYGAGYYTEIGEAKRQTVNQWIRTSKAFDGVIDFDAATRDPKEPKRLLDAYDSCDHLHPNDAGYKAMADAVDLNLFKGGKSSSR